MLLAPEGNDGSGTCVFVLRAASIEANDSDMGVVISELQLSGEHRFNLAANGDGYALTVAAAGFPDVSFRLNGAVRGSIVTVVHGINSCVGSAEPLVGNA